MDKYIFYLQGYQPKGRKKVAVLLLYLLVLIMFVVMLVGVLYKFGTIPSRYQLYIGVILIWLILAPFIKPKAIEIDTKKRKLRIVSLCNFNRLNAIDFSRIVDVVAIAETKHQTQIILTDGSKSTLSIANRDEFIDTIKKLLHIQ